MTGILDGQTVTPNLDTTVHAYADKLMDCLCAWLDKTLFGPVCRCCLVPGDQVVQDSCCDCGNGNGQAAVRVVETYPTSRFPDRAVDGGPCDGLSWAAVYELVVDRCVQTLDEQGNGPSCSVLTGTAKAQADDMAAIRKAVSCCWGDEDDPCASGGLIPGPVTPFGPLGNCLRTSTTVTVQIFECCGDSHT